VELRDLQAFGEPGAIVYLADCVDLMKIIPSGSVDVVFADPPYRLSRGGVTVRNGRLAPVDKGDWDRSMGFAGDHRFNVRWLKEAWRILKPEGTIWVTGTHHIIFSLGFALQTMRFKIINAVAWEKPDPPPNALHTAFTHLKAVEGNSAGVSLHFHGSLNPQRRGLKRSGSLSGS
jgi:site-specific DNA-methyltransferase (adenine-specific)